MIGCAGQKPVAIEGAIILASGQNANPHAAFEIARNRAEAIPIQLNRKIEKIGRTIFRPYNTAKMQTPMPHLKSKANRGV